MSTQIAVRLPDDLVAYLDEVAESESGASRASVVRAALDRDRRARQARNDIRIITELGDYGEFDELAAHVHKNVMPIDD